MSSIQSMGNGQWGRTIYVYIKMKTIKELKAEIEQILMQCKEVKE